MAKVAPVFFSPEAVGGTFGHVRLVQHKMNFWLRFVDDPASKKQTLWMDLAVNKPLGARLFQQQAVARGRRAVSRDPGGPAAV